MQDDLLRGLEKHYGDDPTPILRQHLDFATSSRERGAWVLDTIERRTGIDFRGKRVLDVGCAYAGFVIEAAQRGASAWGVEISRKLYDLGRLNARGEPGDINLVPGDFVAPQVGDALPGEFDVVLVNDVFEHVYDTAGLLAQLSRLTAEGGLFMFEIPNGDSIRAVEREAHYGIAGVSLLPANLWPGLLDSYTAFYRRWSHYSGLFRAFGFGKIVPWTELSRTSLRKQRATIARGLEDAERKIAELDYRDPKVEPLMAAAFEDYRARVHADLERGDRKQIQWRYLTDMWRGIAYRTGPAIADVDDYPPELGAAIDESIEEGATEPLPTPEPAALDFGIPAADLATHWTRRASSEISVDATGAARCVVSGGDDTSAGQYGGLRLPHSGPIDRLELEIEIDQCENVSSVYIDGLDARRCRVLRWRWRCESGATPGRQRHVLIPGHPDGAFEAVGPSYPQLVTSLHLFVCVAPGKRATLVIHSALT